jgi:hypothetical protein
MCICIQVNHVCNSQYNPINSKLWWAVVVACLVIHVWALVDPRLSMRSVIYVFFGAMMFAQ